MNPVAIIGAGITGLTAAFRLRQQNIPVTLYEAGDRVGGAVRTIRENGFMAEYGPNTILETSPKIAALITDLGLDERRRNSDPAANTNYVVRNGKLVPLPVSAAAFAATRLFSIAAKLRIAAEPFIRTAPASDDESLADFVLRRLGREFLDYAINPFVSGIYAGDPAKLSVRYAFPKLHAVETQYGSLIAGQFLGARERKKRKEVATQVAKKVSFDDGLEVLIDTLRAQLGDTVELNSPVVAARKNPVGWTVTVLANQREEHHDYSALLLTAPAHKLAGIRIEDGEAASLAVLGEIEHPAVSRIVLGFRRDDVANPLDGFGFLVPEAERMSILGTTFSSSIFANRAPAGHVTLTSFIGGCRNPELATRDPEELFDRTLRDLRRVLGVRGEPVYRHHVLFPRAIPQYNIGFGKFMAFMTETEARHPGLFFAGNYRNGISLGNSIVSGQDAATRIASYRSGTKRSGIDEMDNMDQAAYEGKQGVLLINLGSPDSPSVRDVRKYLREFLMDPRVLDAPWPVRAFIVYCCILPSRPKLSAQAYKTIWTSEGSPLVVTSRNVQRELQRRLGGEFAVELAMRYQSPSIETAIASLQSQGVRETLVIPMFPHYAASSYETAVLRAQDLAAKRAPEMQLRIAKPYYAEPGYIQALVASASPILRQEYDHLLFSFHGLPERHLRKADPSGSHCLNSSDCCERQAPAHQTCYRAQCLSTVRAFIQEARLPSEKVSMAFQSRLGRDPWMKPYADLEFKRLALSGVKRLLVICPAFVSDCLETLEEVAIRGRATFLQAGGEELTLIPCLNDHPQWLCALEKMARSGLLHPLEGLL